MDIQSKEMYSAVNRTIIAYRDDYYNNCRLANSNGYHLKTTNYSRFIEKDHNPARVVEEYMFIQNKVSRLSSMDRKIIVMIVESAIEDLIKEKQETEARLAELKKAVIDTSNGKDDKVVINDDLTDDQIATNLAFKRE